MVAIIPPDTRALGQSGHLADHNNTADVLTLLQSQIAALQLQVNSSPSPQSVFATVPPSGDPSGATDTNAINAALNAAAPLGQSVRLVASPYLLNAPILPPPGTALLGSPANQISTYLDGSWGTVLRAVPGWSNGTAPWSGVISVVGQADANWETVSVEQKVSNVYIDCHQMSQPNVDAIQFFGNVARPHMENICISHCTGNGINYLNSPLTGNQGPDAPWINHVTVRYAKGYGFLHPKISDANYLWCHAENCTLDGWNVTNLSNGLILGSRSEHNGGNGLTYTATSQGTGSGGGRILGFSTDRNEQHGLQVTSTNATGTPLLLDAIALRRDGRNGESGGGGFAGLNITAFPGSVIIGSIQVFPGVDDDGTGVNSPQYGLLLAGNNSSKTAVLIGAGWIQGATTGISDDGTSNAQYGSVVQATGPTSAPVAALQARQGRALLSGGTVIVNSPLVTATSNIQLTIQTPGGSIGFPYVASRVPGTSFTIQSSNGSDSSTIAWVLTDPVVP